MGNSKINTKLYKKYKYKQRDWLEAYIDLHNRKFELIRTLASLLTVIINMLVLLKVFNII